MEVMKEVAKPKKFRGSSCHKMISWSSEDLETIDCFLDFQEIKECPRKMQKPEKECLVCKQNAQFVYENLESLRLDWIG